MMTFFEPANQRQQVEILRRFTNEILNDVHNEVYAPYEHTEEMEDTLMHLFFSHCGITEIALYFGAPEPVIMEKILSMGLYTHYAECLSQFWHKQEVLYSEPCDSLYLPGNQREMKIEALRRSVNDDFVSRFQWTESMSEMLHFLFRMGEDLTDIAVLFCCPEQIVMQKFIENGLYFSWDTPWFAYADQACRDAYVSGCIQNKYL